MRVPAGKGESRFATTTTLTHLGAVDPNDWRAGAKSSLPNACSWLCHQLSPYSLETTSSCRAQQLIPARPLLSALGATQTLLGSPECRHKMRSCFYPSAPHTKPMDHSQHPAQVNVRLSGSHGFVTCSTSKFHPIIAIRRPLTRTRGREAYPRGSNSDHGPALACSFGRPPRESLVRSLHTPL